MDDGWQIGFHDNTALGWGITAVYFAAAGLSLLAARCSGEDATNARHTWWAVGIGMVLLGINKQLDLQDWLRLTGRDLTQSLGLYQHKFAFRIAFLVLLAALGIAAAIRWRGHFLATLLGKPCLLAGLALLALFIVLSGLHPAQLAGWASLLVTQPDWHWILELGALLLIAISAGTTLVAKAPPRPGSG